LEVTYVFGKFVISRDTVKHQQVITHLQI